MERSVKRGTPAVNRANFKNARKILFGRTIIPGTNRERWTTAGTFKVGEATLNTDFQLGKFTFTLKANNSIYLDGIQIATIDSDKLKVLPEKIYYLPKLTSNIKNDTIRGTKSSVFLKNDRLYINYNIICDINTSSSGLDRETGLWENISDIESAKKDI